VICRQMSASRHPLLAGGPCATSALSGEEMPVSRTENWLGCVPQISLRVCASLISSVQPDSVVLNALWGASGEL
jgi:hypothetical protein